MVSTPSHWDGRAQDYLRYSTARSQTWLRLTFGLELLESTLNLPISQLIRIPSLVS